MLKINRARACTLLLYTETVGRMKGSLPLFIKMCFTLLQTNWLTRRKSTSLLPTSSTVPSANCLATKTIVAGVGFTKPLRSASPPPGGDKQALLTNVQLYLYELAMIFCWFIILFEFSLSLLCLNFSFIITAREFSLWIIWVFIDCLCVLFLRTTMREYILVWWLATFLKLFDFVI